MNSEKVEQKIKIFAKEVLDLKRFIFPPKYQEELSEIVNTGFKALEELSKRSEDMNEYCLECGVLTMRFQNG